MSKEPKAVRLTLIFLSIALLTFLVLLPAIYIFTQAFSKGFSTYWSAITNFYTLSAIRLTVFTAFCCVLFNLLFGLSIGWCLGKFSIPGGQIITRLIELPLSVSPVIAGLIFILFLGNRSLLGGWLEKHGIEIIYAVPGVVIATLFITLPYIAREVIPLMQEMGKEEEEAAVLLGAGGLYTFFHITLPNIKWGVIYGLLITNARAMGEFGAVSVVSGHLRGKTETLTLQVENFYNEYKFTESFAAASLFTFLALFTLLIKSWLEWKRKGSVG
jgi:sulfate/thiosulfate transport system permease protein